MPPADGPESESLRHDEQQINLAFCDLACQMLSYGYDDAELAAGLRKLLEARDCFVRNALMPPHR